MKISKFNTEGYYDPTPYEALKNIPMNKEIEGSPHTGRAFAYRPIVFICSPFADDLERSICKARDYCRFAVDEGMIPIAPHLIYDEKALNVALNKAVGEWEPKALADLLSDLQLNGYNVGATGFDAAEIDDLFSKVHDKDVKDDDTELDAETIAPFVRCGDLWTLGRHRMLCGDATSEEDLNTLMGDVKANLIVTDPPYNVAYESADGKSIQNDSMEDTKFYEFLLAAFKNWLPHLAEGASAYIFHADTEGLNFRRAFKEAGFHISGVCIWVKNSLVLGRSPYQWQHEPVLFGWLPNGKHKWFADRKQTTIWNYDKPKHSKEHPTMKPIPLLAYPIKNSSAPNGIVLDTFGGSGSTLIACEETDRVCYTTELDERYASVIVQRYVELVGSGAKVSVLRDGKTYTYDEIMSEIK